MEVTKSPVLASAINPAKSFWPGWTVTFEVETPGAPAMEREAWTLAGCVISGEITRGTLAFMVCEQHPTWMRAGQIVEEMLAKTVH